jgi:hypothetical protein
MLDNVRYMYVCCDTSNMTRKWKQSLSSPLIKVGNAQMLRQFFLLLNRIGLWILELLFDLLFKSDLLDLDQ